MMRFDRFTERAQDVAARAYEILQRYGHNQVDTEHLLLALLEQPQTDEVFAREVLGRLAEARDIVVINDEDTTLTASRPT